MRPQSMFVYSKNRLEEQQRQVGLQKVHARFGSKVSQLTRTHVQTHEESTQHRCGLEAAAVDALTTLASSAYFFVAQCMRLQAFSTYS